jgi:cysteine desulfurase/selenocysteine lyase
MLNTWRALTRLASRLVQPKGSKNAMCCSVEFEEEARDLSAIRARGEVLMPLRLLEAPSQPELVRLRADFPALAQRIHDKPVVYLDNACMSLRPQVVLDAMTAYYTQFPGCHGRVDHYFGTATTKAYRGARESVQGFLGARQPSEIRFTRNTTESINIIANVIGLQPGDAVVSSDLEHNSNLLPWLALRQRAGVEHRIVPTAPDTTFDLDAFRARLDGRVKLVSVLHSSNLSGVTFPIADIVAEAHRVGALVLVDAAQGMLHGDLDVRALDVDFLAFSGHKVLGPTGTGVLYVKEELLKDLPCFLFGGETVQDSTYEGFTLGLPPDRYEAGLQDYAGAIGLGAALDYVREVGTRSIARQIARLNARATDALAKTRGVTILGPADAARRGGVLNLLVEGVDAGDVAYLLNKHANIMTRSGKHCVHSWYNARKVPNSLRASFSFYNTPEEVDFFVWTLRDIMRFFAVN